MSYYDNNVLLKAIKDGDLVTVRSWLATLPSGNVKKTTVFIRIEAAPRIVAALE